MQPFLFASLNYFRFPNDICPGASGMNGTCYTQEECSARGGTNGGACASGFGICCQSMNSKFQKEPFKSKLAHKNIFFEKNSKSTVKFFLAEVSQIITMKSFFEFSGLT